ncbi:MAG: PaaI family thioesterase [Chloroflexi bacterium]|nr:PaaI family thioesterase [Chloroflexota bacterium]
MDNASFEALKAVYSGRYWARMGIEFLTIGNGRCTCRILLEEHHFNYNDVVHGGVISGLIDSVAGMAVRTVRTQHEIDERAHATSDLHVSYLSPARGTELRAEGRVIKAGHTAVFVEADVRDDQDRFVARGLATFVIGPPRMPLRDTE